MPNSNKIFHLFASCIPVKGFSQSILYDLQRQTYDFITNDLYEILQESGKTTLTNLKEEYGAENEEVLDEYFSFLEQNDYIFFSNISPERFPQIEETFETPSVFSNASIELTALNHQIVVEAVKQLDSNGCQAISVIMDKIDIPVLKEALAAIEKTSIESIELSINYNSDIANNLHSFLKNYTRVFTIYMFESPDTKKIESSYKYANTYLIKENRREAGCGKIHPLYFRVNMPFYLESKNCNNCLNKRLHITSNGDIKSCPFSAKIYGNIFFNRLSEIEENNDYRQISSIRKDEVEVCKDCEFRYMCSDCRIFIQNPKNIYSKPAKCSYNPYIGEWGETF